MPRLELELVGDVPAGLDVEPLRRVFAGLVESDLPLPQGVINLALVDDAQIRELNQRYGGHDYATDVLSFSYIEDGGEPIDGVIGEMAISVETATAQAGAAGTTLAEEVALLALHGVLHIAGYDHQSGEQQAQVAELQARYMTKAGYRYREFTWQD